MDLTQRILTFGGPPDHVVVHEFVRNRSQSDAAASEMRCSAE
jgi:hypothetical protein